MRGSYGYFWSFRRDSQGFSFTLLALVPLCFILFPFPIFSQLVGRLKGALFSIGCTDAQTAIPKYRVSISNTRLLFLIVLFWFLHISFLSFFVGNHYFVLPHFRPFPWFP